MPVALPANVPRKLGCAGFQSSRARALAFEAPRISVIITVIASPASARPTNRGMCIGGLAPSSDASSGSHSATGTGLSSTML